MSPFPLVTLSGAPQARGRQYGAALKDRIARSAALYGGALEKYGISAAHKAALIAEYAQKIADFDENYLEEMRGIAEGSGVALDDIVMINARTEVVALARAQSTKPV
ncbi:MAG: acyl-CoA--6-aminopenicillanic acid acyltransferase, partial [Comamonas sp.]|nr:acyl-CoA--6-aminopenicillanic acid acyltransferase [Comamonas sp.]